MTNTIPDTSYMYMKVEQKRKFNVDNVTLSEKEVTNKWRGDAKMNPVAGWALWTQFILR